MPPAPSVAALATAWTVQPLALVAIVAAALWYARAQRGRRWPVRHTLLFALGLVAFGWVSCGFLAVYSSHLYWVWTIQLLALLLVVPFVLLVGRPIELARAVSPGGRVDRVLHSRALRSLSSPLVGPALIPLLSAVLFFGPLPAWSVEAPPVFWVLQLAVVAIGALVMLPLAGVERPSSSLAAGLAMALGSLELVLDAIPGFALRLHVKPVSGWFDHRGTAAWLPTALRDQQAAGAILWTIAELIDLPFLLLIFLQWVRADARDAAEVDAVLDAERFSRGPHDEPEELVTDQPWWLSDPAMRERLRRNG